MSDFEKWWAYRQRNVYPNFYTPAERCIAEQAYEAGHKSGLEEAAELAVTAGSLGCSDAGFDMADRIADAIRERMK